MTRWICPAAAFLFVASAVPALSQDTASARGKVERVQADQQRLTVKTVDDKTLELRVNDRSKLTRRGEAVTLRQVEPGQRVRVSYRPEAGGNWLIMLAVRPTTTDDVSKEVKEALKAAKDYSYQQKDKYQVRLNEVIDDLDERIDDLQRQAKGAAADLQKQYAGQIETLKAQREVLNQRMAKVRSASAEAWDDIKAGVGEAMEELQRGLEKAWSRFRDK
jgi:flagellar capping protein FliD